MKAHQEYELQTDKDFIIGWLVEHYNINSIQIEKLKQSDILTQLCEEKRIQTEKYYLDEEEAVIFVLEKYKNELTSILQLIPQHLKNDQGKKDNIFKEHSMRR